MSDARNEQVDMTVIVVSFNDRRWLRPCLQSVFGRAGSARLEVVVVDNGSDAAGDAVAAELPMVRVLTSENRGFAHGNNLAARSATGRYVLFLNPDTEIVSGDLGQLIRDLDRRPDVGVAGVRQRTPAGELWPTIRYFPSFSRALGDALASERWPRRPRWAGERELDPTLYARETECDWTSGSFMLVRRDALLSAGLLDERFFLYSEEPDLCLRIKRAGWSVRHMPALTIVHYGADRRMSPRMLAQDAFTRRQYARKHFTPAHRVAYLTAVGSRHLLRAAMPASKDAPEARQAARTALRTLIGLADAPFGAPPKTALSSEFAGHPTNGAERPISSPRHPRGTPVGAGH